MWQLRDRTPFSSAQGWIRDRDGAETWLVVVKATFDLRADGEIEVAAQQLPPLRLATCHGEVGFSSLRCDADFVLTKQTTDIVLIGRAHAPGDRPVAQLDVGLLVGTVTKRLRVFGDRVWGALGPTAPKPFTTMPLVYERAYGGKDERSDDPSSHWEWRNPVGVGYAIRPQHLRGMPLPNIELPDAPIRSWDDRPDPAGFGAIASHWQPRAGLAGRYDADWEAKRQPLLPTDLDDLHFQSAPADQRPKTFLSGGEMVDMVNLSPRGRVRFRLPIVRPTLRSRFRDGESRLHDRVDLHSLILEPDENRFSMVWHSALQCHSKMYSLLDTTIEAEGWNRTSATEPTAPLENILDLR